MSAAPVVPGPGRSGPGTGVVPSRKKVSALRWVLRIGVLLVLGYIGVEVVLANSAELSGATDYLAHAGAPWIALAAAAEAISYMNFTFLQWQLLEAGGVHIGLLPLGAISLAGNAINNSLPGGGAFATVFAYRQLRRRGADEAVSTWTIVAFTSLTAATLAALAVIGLLVAGSGSGVEGLTPLLAVLVAGPTLAIAGLVWPGSLRALAGPPCRWIGAIRPAWDRTAALDRLVQRLQHVRPSLREWVLAIGYASGNWVFDLLCLVVAFRAVGATVPWRGLLLAYGAAQVAANVPITPGGLGVVEGSLTVALVAFGGGKEQTVAAVLLYRILSFWLILPLGWLAWVGLHLDGRRAR